MKNYRNPAVFLDRDGTILTERGYLRDPKKMVFYPGVLKSLRSLKTHGYKLIIISNQSGVGRGYFSLRQLGVINKEFSRILARHGALLSGIYFCPHRPEAGCLCRKPKVALIKKAAREHHVDLSESYMIGDQFRDVLMAKNSGCKGVLVMTGAGRSHRLRSKKIAEHISKNLNYAAQWILKK